MAVALAVLAVPAFVHPIYTRYDGSRVAAALAGRRCVAADSPATLVLAGVLTRDLDRHCPTRIDVSGVTYNVDGIVGANGRLVPRRLNPVWQNDLMGYLLSAQAAIVTRAGADGLDARSAAELRRLKVLYRGPGVSVYAP